MDRARKREVSYRLRGEVDGEDFNFTLNTGHHAIGSGGDAAIRIPRRGVSRRHAYLDISPDSLVLNDLESKNGTFINGRAVDRGTVSVGDELRFGPVSLVVESVDPDDAQLGLSFDAPDAEPVATVSVHDTSLLSMGGQGATGRAHYYLISFFFDKLVHGPEPDLNGALALLTESLDIEGAALVEGSDSVEAFAVATAGTVGGIPNLHSPWSGRSSRRRPGLRYLSDDALPRCSGAVFTSESSDTQALLIWRHEADSADVEPLLSTLLCLARHFWPRPIEGLAEQPRSHSELDFPDQIVVGESPAMIALYQQMSLLHQSDVPVLMLGETGVGKEHLASVLHRSGRRARGPFVAINCAAIPEELLESELFGIGKGVATGVQPRVGRFEQAEGGTLFLDEIGDMPLSLQAKLLRVLQEKELQPLGRPMISVDVRIVAATNIDLPARIDQGQFRRDLYYRLAGYELEVPPLRQRTEDLPRLLGHFVRAFSAETGKSVRGVSVKALRRLIDYPWPGNVRELEHVVRRLVYLCPHNQAIDSQMLPAAIARAADDRLDSSSKVGGQHIDALDPDALDSDALDSDDLDLDDLDLDKQLEAVERRLLRLALSRAAGNQTLAAKLLKISRNGIAKRMTRLGFRAEDFVPDRGK